VETGAVVGAPLTEAAALEAPVVVTAGETAELAVVGGVTALELPCVVGPGVAVVTAGVAAAADVTAGVATVGVVAVTSDTNSKPETGSSVLAEQESSENTASRAEEERTSIEISKTVKDY
jgi:hypothetical protein